jgi:hypothetical protein
MGHGRTAAAPQSSKSTKPLQRKRNGFNAIPPLTLAPTLQPTCTSVRVATPRARNEDDPRGSRCGPFPCLAGHAVYRGATRPSRVAFGWREQNGVPSKNSKISFSNHPSARLRLLGGVVHQGLTPGDFLGIYCLFGRKPPGFGWNLLSFGGGRGIFLPFPKPLGLFFGYLLYFWRFLPRGFHHIAVFPIFGRSTINSFLFLGDRLRLGTSTELNY